MLQSPGQVIVVGSQRSGTTEIFHVLTKLLGYSGDAESHLWPAVATAWDELDRAVERMGGIDTPAFKYFTIGHIGLDAIKAKFANVLVDEYRGRFGLRWVDKTPGVEMVRAVPMLAGILPGAKFLFMRRRGIENVMSKLRRFPNRSFESACTEWSDTMRAWLDVRDAVRARSIEIDQMRMALFGKEVSQDLCKLLDCADEVAAVTSFLDETRSEQTSVLLPGRTLSLEDTGWALERQRMFCDLCAPMMAAYGYSFDAETHLHDAVPQTLPLIFVRTNDVEIESKSGKTHFWWEGLNFACRHGGGPEIVSLRNVTASGQNMFEALVQCGRQRETKQASLTIHITATGRDIYQETINVELGARKPIAVPVGTLDGPLSIEFRAVGDGTAGSLTLLNLLRPRLAFRAVGNSVRDKDTARDMV